MILLRKQSAHSSQKQPTETYSILLVGDRHILVEGFWSALCHVSGGNYTRKKLKKSILWQKNLLRTGYRYRAAQLARFAVFTEGLQIYYPEVLIKGWMPQNYAIAWFGIFQNRQEIFGLLGERMVGLREKLTDSLKKLMREAQKPGLHHVDRLSKKWAGIYAQKALREITKFQDLPRSNDPTNF